MKPYLKYALIACVILIIWMLIQYITGLDRSDSSKYLGWLSFLITLVFIILTIREQKKLNGDFITFGEAFKSGFFMMCVVAVIMSVFTFIYFKFINPDFVDFATEKAREQMENRDLSDEQIEKAMDFTKMFLNTGFMTAVALIGNIIIGAILS